MREKLTSSAAFTLLLFALGGCATATGAPDQQLKASGNDVVVEVENQSWNNVKISVIRDGHDVRLGTVDAMHTESFSVPATVALGADIRLQATPTTATTMSDGLTSGPIALSAGQKIGWRLDGSPGASEGPTRGYVVLP